MGCLHSSERDSQPYSASTHDHAFPALGKNHPLRPDLPKWKSEQRISRAQLLAKREEFWDTAPAYEGRREIWDALKAAVDAFERQDYVLAQAIIDGASISLPYGNLSDCYDELGCRYQIPIYILAYPVNFSDPTSPPSDSSSELPPVISHENDTSCTDLALTVRLSTTGNDDSLSLPRMSTVADGKALIQKRHGVPSLAQRWFYSGRPLADSDRLQDYRIAKESVVQVIVNPVFLEEMGYSLNSEGVYVQSRT